LEPPPSAARPESNPSMALPGAAAAPALEAALPLAATTVGSRTSVPGSGRATPGLSSPPLD
jgi:hypothetical protein